MTTASPIPAAEVAPRMAEPPDTEAQAPPQQARTSTGRPRLRDQVAENPLLTLFGTVIVALLVFVLGTTNLRINDTNHRIDRLEDAMLAGFAAANARMDRLDAKFDRLDAKFDELDRKLTALIAHLNATAAVDAALEHRLVQPGVDGSNPRADLEPPES